ncbi:MAG: chemotaxis response regulator protein-glutamate methylesterase [Ignavibacteriales bacterium]|nr:chemotaxis response regulator protein-glutamate methylesterase [Ignavibacteriales bacterium]
MSLEEKTRVIIVDDSAFMRKSLSLMLSSDPSVEIIATARDGAEGLEKVRTLKPDVVTLDIEMPVMDGLTALKRIMEECPTPVIMVSSLTTEGADSTIKALELGAVDFIPKEMSYVSINISKIKEELIHKVKVIAKQSRMKNRILRFRMPGETIADIPRKTFSTPSMLIKSIALGVSTGGPLSLQQVIPLLPEKMRVPMFIVQHMPPKFTKSLADRLDSMSQVKVKEAENDEEVKPGVVYIAPGGFHMHIREMGLGRIKIQITDEPANTLHRPAVDVMMKSVFNVYGKNMLGVIMTGMGKDGFEGIKELKRAGGYAIAQDEESCVVYGMPKAIVDAGLADSVVPLKNIAETINKFVK